ncbi:DUF2752 domain-containing protein [Acidovorax kalamii]|uniref:DUF2752 domain-containing protein n=1 Tax=Acidovorax kalamii TaxID=2004485 RepID=UPI002091C299|nr:DUF2752 domain-containing protein [Acidovorax kalamii]MCO5357481.1 DUF2752 domain-containing protein [Acidovorax kalamii]
MAPVGSPPAWQPLDGSARRLRLAWGLGWPLAMAATPWWLGQGGLGLGCGVRALTGMPCPLCGGTHACAALVQGDWAAAWAANPGAVLLLVWLVLLAGQAVAEGTRGHRRTVRWPWRHPAVLAVVGGGLLLSWVLRLAGLA